MNTTFDILVIVLGCLLGLFLILSIAAVIAVLKIMKSVRRVVAKGEQVVNSAEAAAEMFKRASAPLGAIKTFASIVESITKHRK